MAAFAPEIITHIGTFPITNTITNTLFVDALIVSSVVILKKKMSKIPGFFQNIIETVLETFYNFIESIAKDSTAKIFPLVVSFFLFILLANWSGLIPGLNLIGFFHEENHKRVFIPLFRNATSDLNVTFALAIISFAATHALSVQKLGIKEYVGRYISLNPINLFVGVLEIVSEFTKVLSLSFRLFGNIFAGEVVLVTVSSIFAFIFPIPFLMLEIIVGLVQALVFSLLTMVFMAVLATPHQQEHHKAKEVMAT